MASSRDKTFYFVISNFYYLYSGKPNNIFFFFSLDFYQNQRLTVFSKLSILTVSRTQRIFCYLIKKGGALILRKEF